MSDTGAILSAKRSAGPVSSRLYLPSLSLLISRFLCCSRRCLLRPALPRLAGALARAALPRLRVGVIFLLGGRLGAGLVGAFTSVASLICHPFLSFQEI